jgi:Zn-dependent M28 family amino/carboxypeptidase
MRNRPARPAVALLLGVVGLLIPLVVTACGVPPAPTAAPPDPGAVAAAITEDGLRARLVDLAAATGDAAPYRAVGSAGYDAAADMVERELRAAGWTVTPDEYTGAGFVDEGGTSLEVGGLTFGDADLRAMIFAPAGEVEGPVITLDKQLDAPVGSAKGCAVTHYSRLPENAIVVVSQGPCLRRDQVIAAQKAGAAAFVAVHPGVPSGVVFRPTLIEPRALEIPAVAVSRDVAAALLEAGATREMARLVTRAVTTTVPTESLIAELPGSEPGAVVMLGAHLDSVMDGPGINDDGSGVAALLEIAVALAGTRPRATIRLAFWSGEELGLHGSYRYATALSSEDARLILVYANVDMISSPNGFAGVYDEPGAPVGSAAARELLASAVERAGGTPIGVDLGGGSDHRGFAESGVATAGVFSGAGEPVSAEQATASGAQAPGSGAVAGQPADACYHQSCDDLANANLRLARVLAAGLADFTVRVANNPELLRH